MSCSRLSCLALFSLLSGCGGSGTTAETSSGGASAAVGGGDSAGVGGGDSAGVGGSGQAAGGSGGQAAAGGSAAGGGSATGGSATGGSTVAFVTAPTLEGNDNPAVPQAAVLRLSTDVAATVEVTVSGGGEEWTISLPAGTDFAAPLIGFKPATAYTVTVSATAGANVLTEGPLTWTSPELPADLPPFEVSISQPAEMEPGMTLFNARVGWSASQAAMFIVDADGVVRWYYWDANNPVREDHQRLPSGNFLFHPSRCKMLEVDVLGDVVRQWHTTTGPEDCTPGAGSVPVEIDEFSHEVSLLESGNLLVLSTELRSIDNFPTSETNASASTSTAEVVGSVIVEFSPDGTLVKHIATLDLLDPTRVGRMSTDADARYGNTSNDWDHANSVSYDAASDSYYASLRHQDAVIKVNRTTEELVWIFAPPANWVSPWSEKLLAPLGDLTWHYHQHAAKLNQNGLGMYDNGNFRASAYETAQTDWSRAIVYSVDDAAMTVSEVWSYGAPSGNDSFFSVAMGDADWQPQTNNVVFVSGQMQLQGGGAGAQLVEVTPGGVRVFQLDLGGGGAGSVFTMYRADRIADIRH